MDEEKSNGRRGVMGSMRNLVLGAAVVAGLAAMGTTTAQAAEFGFHVRGSVGYAPPCPGPGYVWVNGYMANGYWVPGFWNFAGREYGGPVVRYGFAGDRDRGYDRDRGFDRDRGYDRDHGFDRDRGHDRDRGDRDRGVARDRGHEGFRR